MTEGRGHFWLHSQLRMCEGINKRRWDTWGLTGTWEPYTICKSGRTMPSILETTMSTHNIIGSEAGLNSRQKFIARTIEWYGGPKRFTSHLIRSLVDGTVLVAWVAFVAVAAMAMGTHHG